MQALERMQQDDGACGERESPHPGYLAARIEPMLVPLNTLAAVTSKCLWIRTADGHHPHADGQGHEILWQG